MRRQWKAAAIIVVVAGVSAAMWVIGRYGLEPAARGAQERAAKALGAPVERTFDTAAAASPWCSCWFQRGTS